MKTPEAVMRQWTQHFEQLQPTLIDAMGRDSGTLLLALACRLLEKTRGREDTAKMLQCALVKYSEPGDYFDARAN